MPRLLPPRETRRRPMNDRAVSPAISGIPFYAEQESIRVVNTLKTGQIGSQLFGFKIQGIPCSCTGNVTMSGSAMDEQGNLTQDTIAKVLNSTDSGVPTFFAQELDGEGELFEPPLDEDNTFEDDILNVSEDSIFGYSAVKCACCYGSGYVGGFNRINHFYEAFATVSPHTVEYDDEEPLVEINKVVSPNSFLPIDDVAFVQFRTTVPVGSKFITYRLMNNDMIIPYSDYSISYESSTDVYTPTLDLSPMAIGLPVNFRVSTTEEFTHFEILFRTVESPIFIDFPQLNVDELVKDLTGERGTTEIILGTDALGIEYRSIIYDEKYNRFWEVVTLNKHESFKSRKQSAWMETSCRLIQPQEIKSLLLLW